MVYTIKKSKTSGYLLFKNGKYHAESKSKRDIDNYIKLHPIRKTKTKRVSSSLRW